jgi:hypothetical protein
MNTFVFLIDSPFMLTAVQECKALAESVIQEAYPDEHPLPPKFKLCLQAANKMLAMEGVSKEELIGMLDTIGGYYCAVDLYHKNHKKGGVPGQLDHAEELLRFAKKIQEMVRPVWGFNLLKGGKT